MKKLVVYLALIFLVADLFGQSYKIGDLYTAPDGSQGIVFYLHPDGSGGWVVALQDVSSSCKWASSGAVFSGIPYYPHPNPTDYVLNMELYQLMTEDTAGYTNTQLIRAFQNSLGYPGTIAATVVDFENGWYLPAIGQLLRLGASFPFIEQGMTNAGGTLPDEGQYWSSSLRSTAEAWGAGYSRPVGLVRSTYHKVRAIRSFTIPPVEYDTSLTYQWNTGSTAPYITPAPQHTTDYSVTATNESGCTATASQTILVAENMPPEIYDEVCQGEPYEAYGFTVTAMETATPGLITRTHTVSTDSCYAVVTLYLTVQPVVTTEFTQEACGTYLWNGVTLYEIGDYVQHFTSANGCDSTVILHLTLHSPDTVQLTESACNTYTLNGTTYSYSGTYTQHLTNTNGCDSTLILSLTVFPSQQVVVDTTVYDQFFLGGVTYTESVAQTVTYADQYGCDSTVSLNITILHLDTTFVDSTVCFAALPVVWNGVTFLAEGTASATFLSWQGYDSVVVMTLHVGVEYQTYFDTTVCGQMVWNGVTYSQSGNFIQHLLTTDGCDSTVTMHLTVNPMAHIELYKDGCGSYEWAGETYTQSGTYTRTLSTVHGCDSVVTLHLTLNHADTSETSETACDEYVWNGETYTESGDYTQTLTNAAGCDSIVTLHLTVHYADTVQLDTLVCPQSLPLTVRGFTFTGAGTQSVSVLNIHGCDSTSTVHLDVSDTSTITSVLTACDKYFWYNVGLTESGVYNHIAVNADGCPYTRRLDLTVHYSDTTHLDSTVCQNDLPLIWNGRVFYAAGTQNNTLTNDCGCDSLVVMTVHVNVGGFSNFDTTVCGQFDWQGSVYSQSGTYLKPFTDALGCDSLVFAHVTVLQPSATVFDTVVCSGDLPVMWRGSSFEHPDTLTFSYTSVYGCDSTLTLRLRTVEPDTVTLFLTACDLFEWDGDEYYESDTLTGLFANIHGCDSLVTVFLTVAGTDNTEFSEEACGNYVWNGVTYSESGDYTQTFANAAGCDSTATLHLTVFNSYQLTQERTVCEDSLPYSWNGFTFHHAGTQSVALQTVEGCDSVIAMTLHVADRYELAQERTVCEDSLPYSWNGVIFHNADTQSVTLQTVEGCDSVIAMTLHVANRYELAQERTVCEDSLPYHWNGVTFNNAGTQSVTLQTVEGCDSVVAMTLHVANIYQQTEQRTVCEDSLPYIWNGVTFNNSGTQSVTLQTVEGCDSVIAMTLHVSNRYDLTQERTVCEDSLPYTWNGITFNNACTQSVILQTVEGCDSVIAMTLHVANIYQQTEQRTVCEDELPYQWNGITFNNAGTQSVTLQTVAGCDSVIAMTLHVSNTYQQTEQRTVCQDELPYVWNGVTFHNAGTQNVTLQTVAGCDSVIAMTLHVSNTYQQTEQRTVCQDELPYVWNGVTFHNAGSQNVTLQTAAGCDSVITMTLHVSNVYQLTEQRTVCQDELPYSWNGKTFSSAGTQNATLQTVSGCDSVVTMTLHVANLYQLTENRIVCSNELPYVWNGATFDSAGTQSVTLQTVNGCDSVVNMILAVADTNFTEVFETACDSFAWNGVTYTETGDYTETLSNSAGCDSVVTMHLTVHHSDYSDVEKVACDHYDWETVTYTESGNYEQTLTNMAGCDSVVTLHLTVIDTALEILTLTEDFCEGMSAELVAVTEMTDYLWSTGEELPNITVTQPGMYSVTASQGGCHATARYTVEACDFQLWLPNAITPSKSDGLNDVFSLPQRAQSMISDFEISIFNRWGGLVFYSTDKGFKWDGSVEEKVFVGAVYNYLIRCSVNGKPHRVTGSVTVL